MFHRSNHPFAQLIRFGIVGITANIINNGLYFIFYHYLNIEPILANFLGFCIAVFVSYFGNCFYAFRSGGFNHRELVKFIISALIGLGLNSLVVWLITHALQLKGYVAIPLMIFATPIVTFLIAKYWVFPNKAA
jgi:putative flippase GtrA